MKRSVLFLISISITILLTAQVNTDSLFEEAILDSRAGKYDAAIEKAETVLKIHPGRYDVMVFEANVYAWKGSYENAIRFIDKAYSINPENDELYDSWLNILLWSKDYKRLLEVSEIAMQNNYSNQYNLVLKQSLAYKFLGEYDAGIELIENNTNLLDSTALKQLYNEMQTLSRANTLSLFYSIDLFDENNTDTQHLLYADYAFRIKKTTLIPRLNFANRFNSNDLQIEADLYQSFSNGHYLYLNYGAGIYNKLFPEHRAGVEYYLPAFKNMEFSLGGRFLNTGNNNVVIATGHIGKYYRNWWFSLRPYYVVQNSKNALTAVLNTRYYARNSTSFWGLELIYGNSPDERYSLSNPAENLLLKNYRIKLEKNIALVRFNELRLSAAYASEEYTAGSFRNRYTIEILFKHKF
ncbi:MAG: hypothetical protein A2W93_10880 [Bacteroidetes bacterium GWF2_43_63]|nr:MAG: hypothetical protein A2W94_00260 [Bacteroidetes bacterium GWE2_42_42]OFY56418.1 MAG: hypothetical protein A2W93_10880 [Bacteroidetes bacterium GWF2_43_63]HBG72018.1 hypothetical protein [Bacteroidales bacterium]HCB63028.1 hypothetical protein [Bacteroidales bacterium]HCY23247.1 hypothetical protein [Bacteroidales bacterium]